MSGEDDEREERRRQRAERSGLSVEDRLIGEIKRTRSGLPDARSKGKRKYRVVQMSVRVRLRVRAMIDHIVERDQHPSHVELFEAMLAAYLDKYGAIDAALLPTDEDLVEDYLEEQDKRDGQ